MARNNFQYEKRQRELEKKRKAEEKAKRKLEAKSGTAEPEAGTEADTEADMLQAGRQQDLDASAPQELS